MADLIRHRTGYMSDTHDPFVLAKQVKEDLEEYDCKTDEPLWFDTIVGTGMSGCLALPVIARELEVNFYAVRKPNDGSHSTYPGEGILGERILFFDDFIDTGSTLYRILDVIKGVVRKQNRYNRIYEQNKVQFVGAYLYSAYDKKVLDVKGLESYMAHRLGSDAVAGFKSAIKSFNEGQVFDYEEEERKREEILNGIVCKSDDSSGLRGKATVEW